MILYIIRHAWAADDGDPAWADDSLRPLTDEGRERFARLVHELAQRDFAPEVIATSPLVRCRQTAEIAADGLPNRAQVVELGELEPGSDLEGLLRWTNRQVSRCEELAWVGHAPDVGQLTAALIGDSRASIRLAKGAVAAVRFPGRVAPGEGELRWLVTAKLLGC